MKSNVRMFVLLLILLIMPRAACGASSVLMVPQADGVVASTPAPDRVLGPGMGPVLVDQPESPTNLNAFASHDEATDVLDIFIADDFEVPTSWLVGSIFTQGAALVDSDCSTAFNWQIYADGGGVPDGDPAGNGNPPIWQLSLPPSDPQVLLTPGSLFPNLNDVTLTLGTPVALPPGTYWLSVFSSFETATCSQWFWRPADTTNGLPARVVAPTGAFGFPPLWTPVTDPTTWGPFGIGGDFAFRIEGVSQPEFGIDIKNNFEDGPVVTPAGERNIMTVSLEPKQAAGTPAEYWVVAASPFGIFSYRVGSGWGPGEAVAYQGVLASLPPFIVYDGKIPPGNFKVYFVVDLLVNGILDVGNGNGFFDQVKLTIQ